MALFSNSDTRSILSTFDNKRRCVLRLNKVDEFEFTATFWQPGQSYGDDMELSATSPFLTVANGDAKQIKQGDVIHVDSEKFRVRDIKPWGSPGYTSIELKR